MPQRTVTLIENESSKSVNAKLGPENIGWVCGNDRNGWKLCWYAKISDDCEVTETEGPTTDRTSALGRLVEVLLAS